jgi:O-antigen/teichoic acid export membrane protein
MLILVVVFVFCSNFIYLFLNESYQSGISVVLWISLGFAFNGMYKMVSTVFFYTERTSLLSIISSLTALFNGGLVLFLVPLYGVTGAAISTMIAFFIQFLVTWYFSTRLEDMPWRNWKFWRA